MKFPSSETEILDALMRDTPPHAQSGIENILENERQDIDSLISLSILSVSKSDSYYFRYYFYYLIHHHATIETSQTR